MTVRFTAAMQRDFGLLGDDLLRRFAAFLAEVPPHGRIFVDRLIGELLDGGSDPDRSDRE